MYLADSNLVQACLNGDQTAWNALVNRYAKLVYSVAIRYGLARDDADNVFQNVFYLVYRRLDTLRDQKLLAAWITTTTARECWDIHHRHHRSSELDNSIVDAKIVPQEEVELWERRHLVWTALDQLDLGCRELLSELFRQTEKPNYEAIANRFKLPVGSIGPTQVRCFRNLEAILVKMGFDLEPETIYSADKSSVQ